MRCRSEHLVTWLWLSSWSVIARALDTKGTRSVAVPGSDLRPGVMGGVPRLWRRLATEMGGWASQSGPSGNRTFFLNITWFFSSGRNGAHYQIHRNVSKVALCFWKRGRFPWIDAALGNSRRRSQRMCHTLGL